MIETNLITPSGARIGAMQRVYYQMCERAFLECTRLTDEKRPMSEAVEISPEERFAEDDAILFAAIESIVFAAMCLEAAIFDYAAWHLPDHIVESLDKIDFVGKWRTVPYLVSKANLPSGGIALNALIKLASTRNQLVHAKSAWMHAGDAREVQMKRAISNEAALRAGHVAALETIIFLSLELSRISPKTINPLPYFDRGPADRPAAVAKLIANCQLRLRRSLSHA